jgi:peptidylprolyl isomerase
VISSLPRVRSGRLAGSVAAAAAAALLLPALVACSAGNAPDGTAAASVPTHAVVAAPTSRPPVVGHATDLTVKPSLSAGAGIPSQKLEVTDLVVGSGVPAEAPSTVTVRYVGVVWASGKQFDSSWDRGQPDTFALSQTIPGFGQGIAGMKVGGRRMIVIPPALGYGPDGGRAPDIKVDDTLVFVVDLLDVPASDPAAGVDPQTGTTGGAAGGTGGVEGQQ